MTYLHIEDNFMTILGKVVAYLGGGGGGGGVQGARAPPSVSRMNTIKESIKFIRARV